MSPKSRAPQRETLNIRIKPDERGLIDRAARARGQNRTDFILEAAPRAAEDAMLHRTLLESVRKHDQGLQSFRSMRRMEARYKNARPLRLRHSQSLASLRQRLSQAMVRSTIQRLGSTAKPLT